MKSLGLIRGGRQVLSFRPAGRTARLLAGVILSVLGASLIGPGAVLADPAPGSGWPGGVWKPYPASYASTMVTDVPVVMSDGVSLIADIEYPADPGTSTRAAGTFPVLLTQNPYLCQTPPSSSSPLNLPHDYFVQRGYIFVTVCVRGTGRSGGEFTFFGTGRVAQDGVEMVNWAAHTLAGSNGKVGLTGCSFLGFTQLFAAALLQPNSPVKEIAPFCTGASTYREDQMGEGMPTQTINLRAAGFFALIGQKGGVWGANYYQNVISGGPDAYFGDLAKSQEAGDIATAIVHAGIPALLWSGWADIYALQSEELYAIFQNAYFGRPAYAPIKPGDKTTGRYQLVEGPWGHGGGIDQNLQLEWFDTWLKDQATGITSTDTPMHLLDETGQQWINAGSVPMTESYTPYYLGPGGTFSPVVPSAAGTDPIVWAQPTAAGATLTYDSPPLAAGATLAGPIGARIYASSSNTNMELIATLFDVAPDGTATKLTHGSVIGSLAAQDPNRAWYDRAGLPTRPYARFDKDRYLTPGEVRPFDFWISPRIDTIKPGHALRLQLSTQTPPDVCAGILGTDPCTPTAPQQQSLPGGAYTINYSAAARSLINLPLLPLNHFKSAGTGPIPRDWGTLAATDSGVAVTPPGTRPPVSAEAGRLPNTSTNPEGRPGGIVWLVALALVLATVLVRRGRTA
ncbi:MAG: CocE/NonD family hydrolase [Candidatus Dormibacteria bacterium]